MKFNPDKFWHRAAMLAGLEAYFADKNFRKFSPAELVGAGLFGTIATSMVICLILYAFGIII